MPVEHAARIESPEQFEPGSFRSHDIAPGVRLILGKRPGSASTETQAIRFDADQGWTLTAAKRWTKRNGYRVRKWSILYPADVAAPTPNACKTESATNPTASEEIAAWIADTAEAIRRAAEDHGTPNRFYWRELAAHYGAPRFEIQQMIARGYMEQLSRRYGAPVVAERQGTRFRTSFAVGPWESNPDASTARLHTTEAAAHLREAGRALDANPPGQITPGTLIAAGVATHALVNPPKPRQLVQIGTVRELRFTDGRVMRWKVGERWPLLADPGAEKGSAGRTRLYMVPPGRRPSKHEAHKSSRRTFETWHDFDIRRTYTLDVPLSDEFTEALGDVSAIVYRSDKWQPGRAIDYEHEFSKPYPRADGVGARASPRAIQLSGGKFRLTARGLVG
jgi:hypothetical protein